MSVIASPRSLMVTFHDQQILDAAQVRGLCALLAARYQKKIPPALDHRTVIDIHLELNADPSEIWRATPRETDVRFLRFAARVSVALQETLRCWLPYLWLIDTDRFYDFDTTATLLTYGSCRPFTAKNKQAYTFDVLDGDTPRAILYSVKRNITGTLAPIHQMLLELGHPCAIQYAPRRWERILAVYEKKVRPLNSILVAEKELVEEYIARPKIFDQPDHQPNRIAEKMAQSRLILQRRLRKLFAGKDFMFLENLLEIESARAAVDALGMESSFSAKIFANSGELSPLPSHEQDSASTVRVDYGEPLLHF